MPVESSSRIDGKGGVEARPSCHAAEGAFGHRRAANVGSADEEDADGHDVYPFCVKFSGENA
jgi:hypothetical protein